DQGADEYAGRGLLELALDLARDAQFLEHAEHVDPARAGGIADRFRREQSLLQCAGRADVGLRRALAHRDARAGFREIDAAAGEPSGFLVAASTVKRAPALRSPLPPIS